MCLLKLQRVMLKHIFCYLLIFIISSATLPVVAAPTLGEVIETAVQRHPDQNISAARHQLSSSYRQQADAWLGGDPAIGFAYWTDEFGGKNGYRETEASLALPLWLPGQRKVRQQLADILQTQGEILPQLLRWQVAGEVIEKIWALRIAESELSLDIQHLDSSSALGKAVARRVEAGELPRSEVLMAQQEVLNRESMVQNAQTVLESEQAAWLSYTGVDVLPVPFTVEPAVLKEVSEQHPLLRLAQLGVERAAVRKREVRIARRDNPVFSLYVKRDRGIEQDPYNDSLGAEITVPFGTSTQNAPALAEVSELLVRSQAALTRTKRELDLKLIHVRQELERADKALTLAERRNQLAQERMNMSQRAFELGETDLYLLLQAREQAINAARDLKRGQIQRQRATAQYNLALGVLPE